MDVTIKIEKQIDMIRGKEIGQRTRVICDISNKEVDELFGDESGTQIVLTGLRPATLQQSPYQIYSQNIGKLGIEFDEEFNLVKGDQLLIEKEEYGLDYLTEVSPLKFESENGFTLEILPFQESLDGEYIDGEDGVVVVTVGDIYNNTSHYIELYGEDVVALIKETLEEQFGYVHGDTSGENDVHPESILQFDTEYLFNYDNLEEGEFPSNYEIMVEGNQAVDEVTYFKRVFNRVKDKLNLTLLGKPIIDYQVLNVILHGSDYYDADIREVDDIKLNPYNEGYVEVVLIDKQGQELSIFITDEEYEGIESAYEIIYEIGLFITKLILVDNKEVNFTMDKLITRKFRNI